MNNTILIAAEKWFNGLEVDCELVENALRVKKDAVLVYASTPNELLVELRTGINNKKIYISNETDTTISFETF